MALYVYHLHRINAGVGVAHVFQKYRTAAQGKFSAAEAG